MERKCKVCDYYEGYGCREAVDAVDAAYHPSIEGLGLCHRNPGVVEVGEGGWCGEWMPVGYMEWSFAGSMVVSLKESTDAGK